MICCANCFIDSEIIAVIESLNDKGSCDVCESEDTFIYNTEENNNLTSIFGELIDIYTPISQMSNQMKENRADFSLLKDELINRWKIFNVESPVVYKIITEICNEKYESAPELFDESVGISKLYDRNFIDKYSILKNTKWAQFTDKIKHRHRFHVRSFNTEVFAEVIDYSSIQYKKGDVFYRARNSNLRVDPFRSEEMGAPKEGTASSGRVNPLGISCLYLANELDVAIKEIRAGVHDSVTIGKFELVEDIEVIDLMQIDRFSPFLGYPFEQHAVNKEHLIHIANEITKPLKGNDPNIDYLPSQYICDLIKSVGKRGVKYKSTMDEKGFNLAVFDESLVKCIEVSFHEVSEIKYTIDLK